MPTPVADTRTARPFEGIYDVPETARYLRAAVYGERLYPVQSSKLIRWIRRGIASPDLVELGGRELLIGFEDVVSLRVIAALRAAGVSWREIDRSGEWLRTATGARRPFATDWLWTGQGEVFAEWRERLIAAGRGGQLALGLLRSYLMPVHGLVFSPETHAATSWEPIQGVVLKPTIQFGSPCVKGTRIPTRTIAGMIEAGDSADWVAASFDLSAAEVQAACDWEIRLRSGQRPFAYGSSSVIPA